MGNNEPSEANGYHPIHAALLADSYRERTGRMLLELEPGDDQIGRSLFNAPFAVVSHGTQADPVFNYGNATALALFGMTWEEFTQMPSRLSAEPMERDERDRLMAQAIRAGCIDNFTAVRISKQRRRFQIERATLWNVTDEEGALHGQAAVFPEWRYLDDDAGRQEP
jgi:hypothetical protein